MGACCDSGNDLRPVAPSGGLDRAAAGQTLKLEYFPDCYARPDVLVLLLKHKGVEYERINTTLPEWGARKAAGNGGEFGGLPVTHQGGKTRGQSIALLRQLGIQHGYYNPTDWKSAGKIDMLVETYADVFNAFAKILFME